MFTACLALNEFVIFTPPQSYLSTSCKADVLLLHQQKAIVWKIVFLFFFLPFFSLKGNVRNVSVSVRDALLHQNLVHNGAFPPITSAAVESCNAECCQHPCLQHSRADVSFAETCSFPADCR